LKRQELIERLAESRPEALAALYAEADEARRREMGDEVHLRGLIEFSNRCRRNCLYCGLRAGNGGVTRYRMSEAEIFEAARRAHGNGLGTVVLQSGEDAGCALEGLCALVRRIKVELGMAVTLSLGERPEAELRALRDAGADRYLLRFETSDRGLFARIKPDGVYEDRFRCLEDLRRAGFQVGSGVMIGLPGQTLETLADDILTFKALDLDMIGVGPFIPHPDTPLGDAAPGSLEMTLKAVALTRLVTRNAHIPATTALGSIAPRGRQKALRCGANVLMPNLTPARYRAHYQIYPNKICLFESDERCAPCSAAIVESLGRRVAPGPGHSLKRTAKTAMGR
jgi:biotin synthase